MLPAYPEDLLDTGEKNNVFFKITPPGVISKIMFREQSNFRRQI